MPTLAQGHSLTALIIAIRHLLALRKVQATGGLQFLGDLSFRGALPPSPDGCGARFACTSGWLLWSNDLHRLNPGLQFL